MSEHKVSVKWARNSTDFGYKNYNRDHVWRFDSGVDTLFATTGSDYRGPAGASIFPATRIAPHFEKRRRRG